MGVKGMEELGAGRVDNMLDGEKVAYDLCGALIIDWTTHSTTSRRFVERSRRTGAL
jgi:hypothetical protein